MSTMEVTSENVTVNGKQLDEIKDKVTILETKLNKVEPASNSDSKVTKRPRTQINLTI